MLTTITLIALVLVVGTSWGESPPENGFCAPYIEDCVPIYQCDDGVINTSGAGLIDPRIQNATETTATTRTRNRTRNRNRNRARVRSRTRQVNLSSRIGSRINELTICPLDGPLPGVCCRIPHATTPSTTTTTTAAPPKCYDRKVCVDQRNCNAQGFIITDGSGLIDPRRVRDCIVENTGYQGICCSPPVKTPAIANCPGNAKCVDQRECQTKVLNANNNYVAYSQGGSWVQCRKSSQHSGTTGICCQNPVPQYTADTKCGIRHATDPFTRIFLNKDSTVFGEFPWQAILFFKNYTFVCGATLVSNQWLVTAAHCITGYSNQYQVRLGETVVNRDDQPLPTKDIEVSQIIIHPNYKSSNLHNDIALIKLSEPVPYQYHINRVCIPDPDEVLPSGTRCFASGWGKNAFEGGQYQTALKKVDLPSVEHSDCQEMFRSTRLGYNFILDSSFLCAGGVEGKDVCKGDGGGPLVCQYPNNQQQYVLYGITSWGLGCGHDGRPGVYVNVPKFSPWIWQYIK